MGFQEINKLLQSDKQNRSYSVSKYCTSTVTHTEASELGEVTPSTCRVQFEDPDDLRVFTITVTPDEGYWRNGIFIFHITIPIEYNIKVRHGSRHVM